MSTAPIELPAQKKTSLVEIGWDGKILMIRPAGPNIGQRESPIITDEFNPYFKQFGKNIKFLVLDLSTVSFMASMGLGMCIACRNQAAAVGATPLLFGVNKELHTLMSMMKIEKLFRIIKTQAELQQVCAK
ncbi:MAG: STAS domain-containing protein [Planctomycetes bacterium]|nr:STAS domain-containing protein [Planctomycetota bacterium]